MWTQHTCTYVDAWGREEEIATGAFVATLPPSPSFQYLLHAISFTLVPPSPSPYLLHPRPTISFALLHAFSFTLVPLSPSPPPRSLYWEPVLEDSLDLIAKLPGLAAMIYRLTYHNGKFIERDPVLDWAGSLSQMMGFTNEDAMVRKERGWGRRSVEASTIQVVREDPDLPRRVLDVLSRIDAPFLY